MGSPYAAYAYLHTGAGFDMPLYNRDMDYLTDDCSPLTGNEDAPMGNDLADSHATSRPITIPGKGFSPLISTGNDASTSTGQGPWDYYQPPPMTSSAFSRSPSSTHSGSYVPNFSPNTACFPGHGRYGRTSQISLETSNYSPTTSTLSDMPVSPYTAPMSRDSSWTGVGQDDRYGDICLSPDAKFMNSSFGSTGSLLSQQGGQQQRMAELSHSPYTTTARAVSGSVPKLQVHRVLPARPHRATISGVAPQTLATTTTTRRTATQFEKDKFLFPTRTMTTPKRSRMNSDPSKPPRGLSGKACSMKRTSSIKSSPRSSVSGFDSFKREDDSRSIFGDDHEMLDQDCNNMDGEDVKIDGHLKKTQRGRRGRCLTEPEKEAAKWVRSHNLVCRGCKLSKSKCERIDDSHPCRKCEAKNKRNPGSIVCVTSGFVQRVQAGSCTLTPRLTIEHFRLNSQNRRRLTLPTEFDLPAFQKRLHRLMSKCDIRVSLGGQVLCFLNLENCYQFVSSNCSEAPGKKFDLQAFLNDMPPKSKDKSRWEDCLEGCDVSDDNILNVLPIWTNMPNRATYSYVFKNGPLHDGPGDHEDMDVDNEQGRQAIEDVAVLFHMMVRLVELKGFKELQARCNSIFDPAAQKIGQLYGQLGRILLGLRWRAAWHNEFAGDVGCGTEHHHNYDDYDNDDDENRCSWSEGESAEFNNRLHALTLSLYYFFFAIPRRPTKDVDMSAAPRAETHRYEDTACDVVDEFPTDEAGFSAWVIDGGRRLIRDSGARVVEERIGLAIPRTAYTYL